MQELVCTGHIEVSCDFWHVWKMENNECLRNQEIQKNPAPLTKTNVWGEFNLPSVSFIKPCQTAKA